MLTKNNILSTLSTLGVPPGAVVTVHTSLKSIGEIEGGGETLLEALIEYFTQDGGLLVVPTHTWARLDTPELATLDLSEPYTNLGVLPTLALRDGRGVRSMHPTHSVVVFGDDAENFARCDDNTDTFASPDGCYGELYRRGGYILLIGVGNDKNTFIHCVEEMLGVENRNADKKIRTTVKHTDGHIRERMLYPMYTEGCDDISDYFPKYDAAFSYLGVESHGKLGNAEVRLISAVGVKEAMEKIYHASNRSEVLLCDGEIPTEYYK